jgi:lipopolysaccharide export LptBFGC system permease protein LptF
MLNDPVLLASSTAQLNWAILAPLVVIELALLIYCLVDLIRRETVTGGNKLVWAAVIIVLGTLGQIVYLIVGRGEG